MTKLYHSNERFKNDVNRGTMEVLSNMAKLHGIQIEKAKVEIGIEYILEELALFLTYAKICAPKPVTVIYCKRWEVLENLMNGVYDGEIKNVGYIVFQRTSN